MRIHREGRTIIVGSLVIFIIIVGSLSVQSIFERIPWIITILISLVLLLFPLFCFYFFRTPERALLSDENTVFSPADGEIVAIEEVVEGEYFKGKRIQVSIFMSIWNVHVNWYPVGGRVDYFRHHDGRYRVAWHPKSSEANERTSIVVDTGKEKILFRQIAGLIARRIICYAREGMDVSQNSQCGIIKFGSRVDIFLPLNAEVHVKLGEKVTGTQTVIAKFNRG